MRILLRRLGAACGIACLLGLTLFPVVTVSQTASDGSVRVLNRAVQGGTAAEPEGVLLNAVNYLANVIAPICAGGAFAFAIFQGWQGRGYARPAIAGVLMLTVSGLLRLVEQWVSTAAVAAS